MFKRKASRSREFKRNNQVIDFERARQERRERRDEKARKEEEQRRLEEARQLSARKRKKRRNRVLIYIAAFLLIVGILVASAWNIISLQIEKSKLENRNEQLTRQRDDLREELESVGEPDYIEQQARQQLSLIMPGETLYILPVIPTKGALEEAMGDGGGK